MPFEHAKRFAKILEKEHNLDARAIKEEVRIPYGASNMAEMQKVIGRVKAALQKFERAKGIFHETGSHGYFIVRFKKVRQ